MSFSPNLFLSHVRAKDGLAKPSRFQVILPIPKYVSEFVENSTLEKILNFPNSVFSDITGAINKELGRESDRGNNPTISRYLALQCESTELPGKTFQTADAKIYGPSYKVPYQTQYNDASFTFLCTNEFYERKLFDRWMEGIMPTDTNNLRFPKGNETRYMTNIKIIQYDDFVRQIYAIELIDAFPIGIAGQQVSWSEDGFHRMTVQFSYQKYRTIYEGSYDVADALSSLLGAGAARFLPSLSNLQL